MSYQVISAQQKANMTAHGHKFLRRSDLTAITRLNIAFQALMAMESNLWGTITALSRQFQISRMFVYMLASTLKQTTPIIFGNIHSQCMVIEKRLPYEYMLSLRLEGRCSIEAISIIMKRFGIDISSTGSISKHLKYFGSLLPSTLLAEDNPQFVIFFM
jgi:hypothetical protein